MKKLFNRTKRPEQEWDGYDESEYDWDSEDGYEEETVYSNDGEEEKYYYRDEDGEPEESCYIDHAEEDLTEGLEENGIEYCQEDISEYGQSCYEDGEVSEETEYYEEEIDPEAGIGGEEFAEEDSAEDGAAYTAEIYGEPEEDYYEEPEDAYAYVPVKEKKNRSRENRPGFLAKLQKSIASMSLMDRVILSTGVGVLILAIITVGVYFGTKAVDRQVSDFVSVGAQLEDIDVIGGQGLLAVADAQLAKMAAANLVEDQGEEKPDYSEEDYNAQVTVALEMVSIQRDLKIKFVNKKSDKLIANVPFVVNVTDPDGKTAIWSDDDMDGIIYKKDITPGNYQVALEPLTDSRYEKFTISAAAEKVAVKKDIDYKKVNVANEVKSEKEVNAKKEDTKINETKVESTLQDTVAWVESRVIGESYNEVAKSTIKDPMTLLALGKTFMRAATVSGGESSPTPAPAETPALGLSVTNSSITVAAGGTASASAQATASGGGTVQYSCSGENTGIAEVTIDQTSGAITVTGKAAGNTTFTITAQCAGYTEATASLNITVTGKAELKLDKTAMTVFTELSGTITASVDNVSKPSVTAESSETGVAQVSCSENVVTVKGIKAGTATITVKYTENGAVSEASCTVTVKEHPKYDRISKLKDSNGIQLYVYENGSYREAVYADYYNESLKFYVRGETKYTGWQTLDGKVYFFTAEGKKVTGEQVIQGAKYNFASDGSLVQGSNGAMGIDVSKWNGTIDWSAVKNSGVNYVIIRCGYRGSSAGSLIEDPKFTANIKGATNAGLKVGVYFFTQAVDEREAVEEASMVLNQVRNYKISYPIFLDVESSGGRADGIDKGTRTAVCRAFCETIQRDGYTAGIYANKTWLTSKIDTGSLGAYKIWLAQYAAAPTYTGRYDLWQYRSTGNVSGISGNVDMNLSYLGY